MRYIKLQKHITLFFSILLIACITSGCASNPTFTASTPEDEINNFLKQNHSNLDLSKKNHNNGFNIMDSDIDKASVILAGEAHAIATNYTLKLALLKYLNEKHNVRCLLGEMGYSQSCYINEYLELGDESKLKLVYNDLEGTSSWSKEDYDFWIELRKYNLTLPESERIKVIGIDIEHQVIPACEYLNSILPSTTPPKEIQSAIKSYTDSYNLRMSETIIINAIENLQSDTKAKPDIYRRYLGSKYFDFSIVLDNIVNSLNKYASSTIADSNKIRESSIYSNFKRVYSHFPNEKYFGQFGMEHVYQRACSSYMGDEPRFAMYLNSSDSPVKGKVLSIAYGYDNCLYMNKQQNYDGVPADSVINDISILNNYSKTDTTVFKLNGDNSPFSSKTYFVKDPNGGYTTDYFQYIILIRNSKSTLPLGRL